ncbi:PP2C family protein-serine/threonine phosphatase [Streptomyces sp. NPDC060334]|uniref:PP2C family protein-serine/threonine phosphatase n=1 Tax=Streptomyces sp. NPDC060334 TaxID=3347099 RepID=UPI0036551F64
MGHDIDAALAATVLVSALRGARRAGAGLAEQAHRADQALVGHGHGHATGQLLRVNLHTGQAQLVNAGHPWPLRMREGAVEVITCEVDHPSGCPSSRPAPTASWTSTCAKVTVCSCSPTACWNVTESRSTCPPCWSAPGTCYPRETALMLTSAVRDAAGGRLGDDATVMCLDWHGPQENSGTSAPARTRGRPQPAAQRSGPDQSALLDGARRPPSSTRVAPLPGSLSSRPSPAATGGSGTYPNETSRGVWRTLRRVPQDAGRRDRFGGLRQHRLHRGPEHHQGLPRSRRPTTASLTCARSHSPAGDAVRRNGPADVWRCSSASNRRHRPPALRKPPLARTRPGASPCCGESARNRRVGSLKGRDAHRCGRP